MANKKTSKKNTTKTPKEISDKETVAEVATKKSNIEKTDITEVAVAEVIAATTEHISVKPAARKAAAKLPSIQKPMGRRAVRKSAPTLQFQEAVKEVEVVKEIEVIKEVEKKTLSPYVCIQHMGSESDLSEIIEKAKTVWQENNHSGVELKSMDLYVKPEDNAAYYVINGTDTGKVDLGM